MSPIQMLIGASVSTFVLGALIPGSARGFLEYVKGALALATYGCAFTALFIYCTSQAPVH